MAGAIGLLGCTTRREVDLSCLGRPLIEDLELAFLERAAVEDQLDIGPLSNAERGQRIRAMLEASGCAASERDVASSRDPNIVCTLPGRTDSAIVIGAHYDRVDAGDGVADNWSGTNLLPALYQSLAVRPRTHTFVFVAFADEERGLVGSRSFVRDLGGMSVRAMVNLDSLGLGETKVEINRSSDEMICNLLRASRGARSALGGMNVDRVGTSDFESFARAGIPVISLHSLTSETFPILHTDRDRLEALDLDAYYGTYRLLAVYLTLLDQALLARDPSSATEDPIPGE